MRLRMRTTVRIDDKLLLQAKKLAAERGITLTALLDESLRATLAMHKPSPRRSKVRLTTAGGGGVQPGVDLDDTASLNDLMEGRSGG